MSGIEQGCHHLAAALIVGRPSSGKSTYLQRMVERGRSQGKNVGGVISHGIWQEGAKSGFILEAVASGEQRLFAASEPRWQPLMTLGRFFFSPGAIAWGNQTLMESTAAELVVIDEFGPLELDGAGLWPGIAFLVRHAQAPLLIAVRPSLVTAALQRLRLAAPASRTASPFTLDVG